MGNVGWLGDDVSAWFQSEATGYSHLYTVNSMNRGKKPAYRWCWEIYEASLSRNKNIFTWLQTGKVRQKDIFTGFRWPMGK
jgi:hypothetical protein